MVSINTFAELEKLIQLNQLKINILHDVNVCLNIRYQVKSKFETLKSELKALHDAEVKRADDFEKEKQKELIGLEHSGHEHCQEHAKLMHQIEHINWHLGHAHPHDVTTPIEAAHHSLQHQHSAASTVALNHGHGKSSCSSKPSSNLGYLQISAERFIKSIAEMRRKICLTKHNLEMEIERKRIAEKNLSDMRREVSKQKKMISMRRCVPLPAITAVKKCVK